MDTSSIPIIFLLVILEPLQCFWNVLIYFRLADRVEVVKRLSQRLNHGGYLFLGPAEVVGLHLPGLELIRWRDVLVYKRVD